MRYKRIDKKMLSGPIAVLISLVFLTFSIILSGCFNVKGGGPKQYVRKAANFQFIKKIAVIPLNNLSDDEYAGEKIKNAVVIEILERGIFDLAEEGEVNQVVAGVFKEMGFAEGDLIALETEAIQKISERLGVQALLMGTVEFYGMSRSGGVPHQRVSISLRLSEAKSGLTLWRASHTVRGSNFLRTILGLQQKDELRLSRDIAKALLDTLFGR